MDEMLLLRRVADTIPAPAEDALARGRAALDQRIASPSAHQAPRRRRRLRAHHTRTGIGIGIGIAAGVAVVLVATDVVGLAGWRGSAEPAAAEVLHDAAALTLRTSDPTLLPDQYLEVSTTAVWGASSNIDESQRLVTWLTITDEQLYIPADRDDDWVWVRGLAKPYATFGADSKKVADRQWASISAEHGADYTERIRAPRGEFFGSPPGFITTDQMAGLPRDPYLLLNHIYWSTIGQGPSPDGEALVWIADLLRTGAVPADLRAALYKAAAMIPGVEVTDNQATLDGTTGIAIGRLEDTSGVRQDIIIDPETGRLIGERSVSTKGDRDASIPAGTATSWTAVHTTVVDSAPRGGTPNGAFDEMGCKKTSSRSFDCPVPGE
jgi:hypothetical protein